jgi:hypothetical protein
MITGTHRIANIVFRTESDIELQRFFEPHFNYFLTQDGEADVVQKIYQIPLSALKLPAMSSDTFRSILQKASFPPGLPESPLLQSPRVRTKVVECLENPEEASVRIDAEQVIVRDYSKRILYYFALPRVYSYAAKHHICANYPGIFSSFLPCFSAFMIHAASVVVNHRAAVFLAPDDGGKTTVTQLARDAIVLQDDQVILRMEDHVPLAYATPMNRNTSGAFHAKVGGFFFLEKADSFELIPTDKRDMAYSLWRGNLGYSQYLPARLKKAAFDTLYECCDAVPSYVMRFPKSHVDWDAIAKVME